MRDNTPPPLATRVAPLFGHELRSQIAAILGYEELLADGVLGPIGPEALDALGRIRRAGRQMLALADGVGRLLAPDRTPGRPASVDLVATLRSAAKEAAPVDEPFRIEAEHDSLTVDAEPDALQAALVLILGAVLRTRTGDDLVLHVFAAAEGASIEIAPTGLDPVRDGAALHEEPAPDTGPGLRLAMAAALLRGSGGAVRLDPGQPAVLRLEFPRREV